MIEIKNLEFSYSRFRDLFTNLSLTVEVGHISGLLGKNGEGKTTLLKLIAGQLLRESGTISVLGEDPGKRSVSFLSEVYYLPEVNIFPSGLTIGRYFDALSVFYPNFSQEVADDAIRDFELNYDLKLNKLSQGMRKKAAIAFALSLGPRILLLDEPTNGLDIPGKSALRRLLAKHITEERSVIISTHQVRDLEQIIDHLIVMQDSEVILSSTIEKITEHLAFRLVEAGEEPIYSEMTPAGKLGIFERRQGLEGDTFSTELFFNALATHRTKLMRFLSE